MAVGKTKILMLACMWCFCMRTGRWCDGKGVLQALEAPSPALQMKLARARRESKVVDISRAPVAYDTAQPEETSSSTGARKKDADYEIDDWDSRLKRRL